MVPILKKWERSNTFSILPNSARRGSLNKFAYRTRIDPSSDGSTRLHCWLLILSNMTCPRTRTRDYDVNEIHSMMTVVPWFFFIIINQLQFQLIVIVSEVWCASYNASTLNLSIFRRIECHKTKRIGMKENHFYNPTSDRFSNFFLLACTNQSPQKKKLLLVYILRYLNWIRQFHEESSCLLDKHQYDACAFWVRIKRHISTFQVFEKVVERWNFSQGRKFVFGSWNRV